MMSPVTVLESIRPELVLILSKACGPVHLKATLPIVHEGLLMSVRLEHLGHAAVRP